MFRAREIAPLELSELDVSAFQRRRLAGSWVLPFRNEILPLIDEQAFSQFFHQEFGAPNRSISVVLGILLLKDFLSLTDEEALEAFAFDLRWHIALAVDPSSLSCCQKTLYNFRVLLQKHDKARFAFENLTDRLVKLLALDTSHQRLDSTHCQSNVAILKRLALFCETLRLFLRRLQRFRELDYVALPGQLRQRYHTDKGDNTRYDGAVSEVGLRRLPVVARDLFRLVTLFAKDPDIALWTEFLALQRVLAEQCDLLTEPEAPKDDDDDLVLGPVPVSVRAAKKVAANSLQTPHDPDVSYGKKGQGYEVQVCETFGNKNAADPNKPELITHVDVTPSCKGDIHNTIPTIENLKGRGIQPKDLETDSNFTSSEVIKEARGLGTEVNGPVMGSKDLPKADEVTLGDFRMNLEEPAKSSCPVGHALNTQTCKHAEVKERVPEKEGEGQEEKGTKTKVRISLSVIAAVCLGCDLMGKCPAKEGKGEHSGERVVETTEEELISAQRRRYETTAEFRERYANRAGIEATNSELKRRHGLKKLTVRGLLRVKVSVHLKALACNIKRVTVYLGKYAVGKHKQRKGRRRSGPAVVPACSAPATAPPSLPPSTPH
jgi:hypothetical protein